MSALVTVDLLARGGAIALLMLWSWLLLRDNWHALAARAAVAMNAAIFCYIVPRPPLAVLPLSDADPLLALAILTDAASVLAPGFFWLFAYVWFTDAARVRRGVWVLLALFGMLPVAQLVFIQATGALSNFLWLVIRIGMVGFGLAGIWIAWRGRDNDLVESRRRFRSTITWIIGGFVIWVSLIEIPVRSAAWTSGIRAVTEVAIALTTFFVSVALYRFAQPHLFDASPTPAAPLPETSPPSPSPLALRLQAHMLHHRTYRTDGLTIAALAAQLGEQEYRLRRLINGELGHRNFSAFLNGYRLEEVKAALADAAQAEVPIITIALDAGFGSLGPFNRAFREAEGVTPSRYRQQHMGDSGIG